MINNLNLVFETEVPTERIISELNPHHIFFCLKKPGPSEMNCIPLEDVEDIFDGTPEEFNSHLMWMTSRLIKVGYLFNEARIELPELTSKDIWVNGQSHNVCFMGRPIWDAIIQRNKISVQYVNEKYIQSIKSVMKGFLNIDAYDYVEEWANSNPKKNIKEELEYWDECIDLSTKRVFLGLKYDESLIYDC
jgi:uncharacterized short protein YbdD (DUF466 family)